MFCIVLLSFTVYDNYSHSLLICTSVQCYFLLNRYISRYAAYQAKHQQILLGFALEAIAEQNYIQFYYIARCTGVCIQEVRNYHDNYTIIFHADAYKSPNFCKQFGPRKTVKKLSKQEEKYLGKRFNSIDIMIIIKVYIYRYNYQYILGILHKVMTWNT